MWRTQTMSDELNDMLKELAEKYIGIELEHNPTTESPWRVFVDTDNDNELGYIEAGGLSPLGAVKNLKEKLKDE